MLDLVFYQVKYILIHLQHTFPHDFRSGPSAVEWDPSKWIILGLQKLGLVTALRRAGDEDLIEALRYMNSKEVLGIVGCEDESPWDGEIWNFERAKKFAQDGRCVILLGGFVVDATSYLGKHVSYVCQTHVFDILKHCSIAWRCNDPSKILFKIRE